MTIILGEELVAISRNEKYHHHKLTNRLDTIEERVDELKRWI